MNRTLHSIQISMFICKLPKDTFTWHYVTLTKLKYSKCNSHERIIFRSGFFFVRKAHVLMFPKWGSVLSIFTQPLYSAKQARLISKPPVYFVPTRNFYSNLSVEFWSTGMFSLACFSLRNAHDSSIYNSFQNRIPGLIWMEFTYSKCRNGEIVQ